MSKIHFGSFSLPGFNCRDAGDRMAKREEIRQKKPNRTAQTLSRLTLTAPNRNLVRRRERQGEKAVLSSFSELTTCWEEADDAVTAALCIFYFFFFRVLSVRLTHLSVRAYQGRCTCVCVTLTSFLFFLQYTVHIRITTCIV